MIDRIYSWIHNESGVVISMTQSDIEAAYNAIGVYTEELAEMLTGLTCDAYSDLCEESDLTDFNDPDVQLCEAYHRILNATNSDNEMVYNAFIDC